MHNHSRHAVLGNVGPIVRLRLSEVEARHVEPLLHHVEQRSDKVMRFGLGGVRVRVVRWPSPMRARCTCVRSNSIEVLLWAPTFPDNRPAFLCVAVAARARTYARTTGHSRQAGNAHGRAMATRLRRDGGTGGAGVGMWEPFVAKL